MRDLSDRFIDELSGGQRQRVLVTMAFAQDTDNPLLNEPLNNLDMHYASVQADLIVAMKNGKISAQAATGDFMREETPSAFFDFPLPIETLDGHKVALHHG